MAQPLGKTICWFLRKLNRVSPYDPALGLLGIQVKELQTCVHTKSCTRVCTAPLFIIAQIWKKPRRPPTGECVHTLGCNPTMGYCSALKTSELPGSERTCGNFACIFLRERGWSEKPTHGGILSTWPSGKGKSMGRMRRSVVAQGGLVER